MKLDKFKSATGIKKIVKRTLKWLKYKPVKNKVIPFVIIENNGAVAVATPHFIL